MQASKTGGMEGRRGEEREKRGREGKSENSSHLPWLKKIPIINLLSKSS
jgi:hypothetical protein